MPRKFPTYLKSVFSRLTVQNFRDIPSWGGDAERSKMKCTALVELMTEGMVVISGQAMYDTFSATICAQFHSSCCSRRRNLVKFSRSTAQIIHATVLQLCLHVPFPTDSLGWYLKKFTLSHLHRECRSWLVDRRWLARSDKMLNSCLNFWLCVGYFDLMKTEGFPGFQILECALENPRHRS